MIGCYVNAAVSAQVATNKTDFIIGSFTGGTVTNSFYSSDASCTFNSGTACPGTYGTAKTSAQLKQKATFTGFDFDSANPVWKIVEGVSSPTFTWQ